MAIWIGKLEQAQAKGVGSVHKTLRYSLVCLVSTRLSPYLGSPQQTAAHPRESVQGATSTLCKSPPWERYKPRGRYADRLALESSKTRTLQLPRSIRYRILTRAPARAHVQWLQRWLGRPRSSHYRSKVTLDDQAFSPPHLWSTVIRLKVEVRLEHVAGASPGVVCPEPRRWSEPTSTFVDNCVHTSSGTASGVRWPENARWTAGTSSAHSPHSAGMCPPAARRPTVRWREGAAIERAQKATTGFQYEGEGVPYPVFSSSESSQGVGRERSIKGYAVDPLVRRWGGSEVGFVRKRHVR